MNEPTGVPDVARLLDEIRGDVGWREAIEQLGAPRPDQSVRVPAANIAPPQLDPDLRVGLDQLANAVELADTVVRIEPSRPIVGAPMASFRQKVHAEIRISQDRQTVVNLEIVAVLRRLAAMLDPAEPDSIGQLPAVVAALAQRIEAMERRLAALAARVAPVESSAAALALELEPLGHLRAVADTVIARLDALEGSTGRAATVSDEPGIGTERVGTSERSR